MANIGKLAKVRQTVRGDSSKWGAVYCSTSIANFRDKLARKFNLPKWHFLKSTGKSAAFFGLYNPVDYFRFIWHRGDRTVFWCGGDILNLQKRPFWQKILRKLSARHICENMVEYDALRSMGIEAEVRPCLVDRVEPHPVTFKPSKCPHVYLCARPGREWEYGVETVELLPLFNPSITYHIYGVNGKSTKRVIYHGEVPVEQFNKEIDHYHCALRLNEFDGFSEVLANAMLRGQYAITKIPYPFMWYTQGIKSLVAYLDELTKMKKPNLAGREYWTKELMKPL